MISIIRQVLACPSPKESACRREDVIITKLRCAVGAARGKDRDDVRDVIAVLGADALDWEYIYRWAEEHGTRKVLDEIRATIPEI